MSRIECFETALSFIPEEYPEVRECLENEITKARKKTAVNPTTLAAADAIKSFMENVPETNKKELQEVCNLTHQRVQAACNYLESHGYLTTHCKDENHKIVWYTRN